MENELDSNTEKKPPIALVQGTPFLDFPEDLYIPPDALEVCLDAFEGPLDLLLYLIRKQNLDILNIPIAHITTQYISYIEMMSELRLELAAEYLLMAALLAEIKSRMLLPRQPDAEDEKKMIHGLFSLENYKNMSVSKKPQKILMACLDMNGIFLIHWSMYPM